MNRKNAFTLLEMSIVLTIIGLLIGGILVGRSLIRASQVQSVLKDVDMYSKAVREFQDKYSALPGDMKGATTIWGSADGVIPSDAACQTTIGTGATTCDGNGDGQIALALNDTWTNGYESGRAWQHLANAGFIPGSYNGVSGAGGSNGVFVTSLGTNVPKSQLTGGGYTLFYIDTLSAVNIPAPSGPHLTCAGGTVEIVVPPSCIPEEVCCNNPFGPANGSDCIYVGHPASGCSFPTGTTNDWIGVGHVLVFGGSATNSYTNAPLITASEAYGIDMKIDDGVPSTGSVKSETPGNTNCVSSSSAYSTSAAVDKACSLIFYLGF